MNKFFNFMERLSKNPKWNIFMIVVFSMFAILEIVTKDIVFAILDILIILSESFELKNNLRNKKNKK